MTMMKNLKYVMIMFLALTMSVACSSDDDHDSTKDPLVGTWSVSESQEGLEISITATFNANFTGKLVTFFAFGGESESETENFTWSTNGNKLTLVIDGETQVATYSISGNKLTITDDEGEILILTRE